jgi:phosphoribosylformylglycinamidine (FGAM) synthase-like amidotransferase family enzyme
MGLMPHPERASESIISPGRSTNKAILIFKSLISYLTNSNNILYHRKNKR